MSDKEEAVQKALELLEGNVAPDSRVGIMGLSSHELAFALLRSKNTNVSCSVDLDGLVPGVDGARVFGCEPMEINDYNEPTILMNLESINPEGMRALKGHIEHTQYRRRYAKITGPQIQALLELSVEPKDIKALRARPQTLDVLQRRGFVKKDYPSYKLTTDGWIAKQHFAEAQGKRSSGSPELESALNTLMS